MPIGVRNPLSQNLTMPAPFRGILKQGQGIALNYTEAQFDTLIGGSANRGNLQITNAPTATVFDTTFDVGALTITSLTMTGSLGITNAGGTAHTIGLTGSIAALAIGDSLALASGSGGAATAGAAGGAGGAYSVNSGAGGAGSSAQAGGVSGAVTIKSGTGGVGTATAAAGASGVVTLQSGDAGAATGGTGANSGNVVVDAGAPTGSGTAGAVVVGATNAESVVVGRTGKNVSLPGALAVTQATTLTGGAGVGGAADAKAILTATSTTKGFLPPRMTTGQRDAIATPPAGLMIYNTTTNKLNVFTTGWEAITSA